MVGPSSLRQGFTPPAHRVLICCRLEVNLVPTKPYEGQEDSTCRAKTDVFMQERTTWLTAVAFPVPR
jgi:hypothetical protein